MAGGHKSLKRIIHRCFEEFRATCEIAKVTSLKKALITFAAKVDIQKMNHNGYKEPPKVKARLMKKHDIMIEYFEKRFEEFYNNYDYNQVLPETSSKFRNRIWVCWWQGEENAPILVQKCIESIRKSAKNHVVTVITEDNYRDFVNIPDWFIDKFDKGILSRTNFSDLLRVSLLAQYGGMWLDSTFFCTADTDLDMYFKYDLWSIKRPDYLHCSIASGYFAGYSLQCSYEQRYIFAVIRDFFLHYWQNSKMLIDYLLIDYMIVLAQKYDQRIENLFESIVPNNPFCDDLLWLLNEKFDSQKWKELTKNTYLYKLSWKYSFVEELDGEKTFYAKLIENKL